MIFSELAVGDRFASGNNPNNRLFEKISMFRAIDRSEGINSKKQYIIDRFNPTDRVILRNDVPPATDFNPALVIESMF